MVKCGSFKTVLIEGTAAHEFTLTREDLLSAIGNPHTVRVVCRNEAGTVIRQWERDSLKDAAQSARFRRSRSVEYTVVGV